MFLFSKEQRYLLFITLFIIILGIGIYFGTLEPVPELEEFNYTIMRGDTLWKLADKYAPEGMSNNRYIYKIRELNDMEGVNLIPGETVILLKEGAD